MKKNGKESDIERRMRFLEKEIRHHQNLYYVRNRPVISDREFDRLLDELMNIEAKHPELASPDSPTRMVGSDLDAEFPKFKHTVPILSLANTYSTDEALEWVRKVTEGEDPLIDVQWKVDGATLVLYYERGRLVRAVTRGSGQVGDEVTANALTIRNIPHLLSREISLVVRGEAYMTFEDFQSFNDQYGSVFANPRNLTAGSLKQKKSREVAQRPIRWVAFDSHFEIDEPDSDKECLELLKELGLPVFEENAFVRASEIRETIESFARRKGENPLPVDGLVLKLDDRRIRERQGFTAQAPRWAVALKFEPETAQTVVEKIEVFVGRTGRVTPRAKLGSVRLAGTTVSYATLHNADFIGNLDVREGSTVIVSKRGEIIPAVEEVVDRGPGDPFVFPTLCPSCGTPLRRDEDAVDWLCPSDACPEKIISGIIFFAQRKQMDINGLGERIVRILYERGFISRIEDLYRLKERRAELEELEGFGEKSVRLLLDGIERSTRRDFRYVLPALGLREIGPSVTELLIVSGCRSIDEMIRLASLPDARERLVEIAGIGPRTAEAIAEQLTDPIVQKRIETLRSYGLRFAIEEEGEDAGAEEKIFEGQSWCVTGSFEHFNPRDRAMDEVRRRGGRVVSAVTSKTTHLLAGEKAGSKIEKARELGTQIVSEGEFLKMLGRKGESH